MIGLCLGLDGGVWAQLPVSHFTLAWNHSIEKIRWEEDYRLTREGLVLEGARIRGNGAGMEIPDDARLELGSWHFKRTLPPLQPLKLGRTPEAGDYQLCLEQVCHAMSHWVGTPSTNQPFIQLWSCETDRHPVQNTNSYRATY
ncbi:DUF1850 domain-containing protein [Pseudomonas sp. SWRI59]|uniref:DUF1850 domain-containing protein n=1 Tax=Pseudomonas TaxID=286 RepID=UPI001644E022|nr:MULTISPECIES: DUF1850 domain-containing protein [unclassified Pseudomonas]MBC3483425.1 DUF1850 domain-containing protein [Pseudomonas sp. SWRI77]MBC3503075.1 DUF1850 domain-containing protein [Pseudomonas sp. SWRI59]MBC3505779.1 DUF1850 domain-containing protein [Pseudomonas sp. SWRI68]UVL01960.1 DUF1850 domain-containing protein [Pseudomonas sp. B21-047]